MPTQNTQHVDALLTNVSIANWQSATNFIAGTVFPEIPVQKQSDLYVVIPAGDFNRDEMAPRADASQSAGGGYETGTDSYFCQVNAFHKDLGEQVKANSDTPFALRRATTAYLTMKGLIFKEKEFVRNFFSTGLWTTEFQGVASSPTGNQKLQWNDPNSDPIGDIKNEVTAQMLLTGGFKPTDLIIGPEVRDALELHPDIVDRVKYGTQSGVSIPTLDQIATLMNVQAIHVMEAVENTAGEGLDAVNAYIGGKHALLVYRTPTPGILEPSAGYTFTWAGLAGQGGMGTRILRYDIPLVPNAERIEIETAFDMKQISADMGTFYNDIVA